MANLDSSAIDTDDPDLPNHTICMRRVLKYCVVHVSSLSPVRIPPHILQEALVPPSHTRRQALQAFTANQSAETAICIAELDSWDSISASDLKRLFQRSNLPCKIKNASAYFPGASEQWTQPQRNSMNCSIASDQHGGTSGSREDRVVNRDWFVQALGVDAVLPVRYSPRVATISTTTSALELDDQGRATVCETVPMTLAEWIEMLDAANKTHNGDSPSNGASHMYYLKDWHLMKSLHDNHHHASNTPAATALYSAAPHFQPDLLNDYLRFSDGDYKFVYWGPKGSQTALHSDVMGSFSWSYNVCGTKEWTIHVPPCHDDDSDGDSGDCDKAAIIASVITVRQTAGECMFVPAGWVHSVVNVDNAETLSINHNWITTANIDIVWDTLQGEMKDIDAELNKWSDGSDTEAQENMLLGCVGLNVTAFYLMNVLGLVNALRTTLDDDAMLDIVRLEGMIRTILVNDADALSLQQRLEASLGSTALANIAQQLADALLQLVHST